MESEEKRYRVEYSTLYDTILSSYVSNGAESPYGTSFPLPVSEGTEVLANNKYINRQDLLPESLAKGITPLEFECCLEKFLFWHIACFGSADPTDRSMAVELRMKLDTEWFSLLKTKLTGKPLLTLK